MRKVITTITLCSIIFSTSIVYGQNKQVDLEKKLTENRNSQLRLDEQNYLEATKQNILSIYDEMETNQIFGTKEISDILHFSSSGARRVLNKIIDTGVVTSVKGKGKGRYRFLNNEEIK